MGGQAVIGSRPVSVLVLLGDPDAPASMDASYTLRDFNAPQIELLKGALASLEGYRFRYLSNHATLLDDLQAISGVDLVFNQCDEGFGNDLRRELNVPAMLEVLGLPYAGAGPASLAKCFDKHLVLAAARDMGIAVPASVLLPGKEHDLPDPPSYPAIVKPNCADGSLGVSYRGVAENRAQLPDAVAYVRSTIPAGESVLIQEFLPGREFTIGVVGNPPSPCVVLPILEDEYSDLPPGWPPITGYESKWGIEGVPYDRVRTVVAGISPELREAVSQASLQLVERFECWDFCRLDWRLDADGEPRLLEVNPNPGLGTAEFGVHLGIMADEIGWGYAGLLAAILDAACRRTGMRDRHVR